MTLNTKSKIDLDEFKEVMKDLTLDDILPIALAAVDFMKNMGEFIIGMVKLQKKSEKAYNLALKLGEEPEAFLTLLVGKIPEEKLKPLVELTLKLAIIQAKIREFEKLSPDEKIILGEELKEVATKISKVLKERKK